VEEAKTMANTFPLMSFAATGYVGIVLREPGRNTPLQAVNGKCVRCSYRLAWIVIRGNGRRINQRKGGASLSAYD
jgi:hypothetical protein